jgi:hypothetical protein
METSISAWIRHLFRDPQCLTAPLRKSASRQGSPLRLFLVLVSAACAESMSWAVALSETTPLMAGTGAGAPRFLSDTGLYAETATETIASDVLFFEPQFALWTDGLEKERHVWLPRGAVIDNSNSENFIFPVGTKLWKTFSGRTSDGHKIKVETRLAVKGAQGWEWVSYRWKADGSDAALVAPQGAPDVFQFPNGATHSIPSRMDCQRCHMGTRDPVLGFSGLALSGDPHNPRSPRSLDLRELERRGLLARSVAAQPRVPARSEREARAVGYLAVNCGNCHRPGGSASFTRLWLHFDPNARDFAELPIAQTAMGVAGAFVVPGFENDTQRIHPGRPEASSLHHRMTTAIASDRMPPLGTQQIDSAGAELIRDWISGLSP